MAEQVIVVCYQTCLKANRELCMAYGALIQDIVHCAERVHAGLGPGFLESIYGRALTSEFRGLGLSFEKERIIRVWYGPQLVGKHRLDLVVGGTVVVELKANRGIASVHVAQLRSYLQAAAYPIGLILNFGRAELEWEVLEREPSSPAESQPRRL